MSMNCALCGRPLQRRWWQRGLLAPLVVCVKEAAPTCEALLDAKAAEATL